MQLEATGRCEAAGTVAILHVGLLGGFAVERNGFPVPDFAWQRRSAKRLTKLLATVPSHALHREQILDIFWPNADVDSARNSLAKALHAARRALEPERPAREDSSYLQVRDDMILLRTDHVLIDADDFQRLAQTALRAGTVAAYERALAAYTGVLLPEDLYEDWPSDRRLYLAELHVRMLLGLAEALAQVGAHLEAIDRLQSALLEDPTREDVHRQIMRLYSAMGARGLAIRQFQVCRSLLLDELNVVPDRETTLLYEDLVADDIPARTTSFEQYELTTGVDGARPGGSTSTASFASRV